MKNKQAQSRNSQFRILFLLITFLFMGTGCFIFHRYPRGNGQLISTPPHGRLAPGEVDDMSGNRNGNQNAPKQDKKHRRE